MCDWMWVQWETLVGHVIEGSRVKDDTSLVNLTKDDNEFGFQFYICSFKNFLIFTVLKQ